MNTKTPNLEVAYEPPLSDPAEAAGKFWHAGCKPLAKGVLGYAFLHGEEIWIPFILAEKKGAGDVGRFLDSLSARCVIVDVTSPRLEAMLIRRRWKKRIDDEHESWRKNGANS